MVKVASRLTSGGFSTTISMMFGMNLGRWQHMKTPTIVIEILVSLKIKRLSNQHDFNEALEPLFHYNRLFHLLFRNYLYVTYNYKLFGQAPIALWIR